MIEEQYLLNLLNRKNHLYRHYTIDKKDGGKRLIYHPCAELKTLQYWLVRNIFNKLPISPHAYAYMKGKSIKQNALQHKDARNILHLDIKNFFNGISEDHIKNVININIDKFNELEFDITNELDIISNICQINGGCPIGAVTSPIISNAILYNFDNKISAFANANNLVYTRYADDIFCLRRIT